MRLACTNRDAENKRYVPPPLGNGDLSFQIDFEGGMGQQEFCGMVPGIHRAGFRYDTYYSELVPFGYFEHTVAGCGKPTAWKQTLDPECGVCETCCNYRNGIRIESEVFCHLEHNIIAIRKRISGEGEIDSRFTYTLKARRMSVRISGAFRLDYAIDTVGEPAGSIFLLSPEKNETHVIDGHTFELRSSGRELTFFLAFGEAEAELAGTLGYEGLLKTHLAAWKAFRDDSKIRLPEGRLLEVCRTAEYHLRISSTKWSIPVGLFPTHWQGRYFGFDEYFAFSGLLLSGHAKEAKKVPLFRHSILPAAMKRAYTYFGKTSTFARYQWETVETPLIEGAPQGFWLEHIFHMAHIGLESRKYYDVTRDRQFLRENGYPVIKACAEFFRIQAACELGDGRVIIGKCVDLERLGPARENAFMTTCGAIATLQAAATSAEELETDPDIIPVWRTLAERLLETLPEENGKYVPYPGCAEKSIALLSGVYPYAVLPPDDPKQLAAIRDFCETETSFGNMYPVGKSICARYAGWKSIAFTRLGRKEEARMILEECAADTGCFSELFEIHETGSHPWFTTAEGVFLEAVMELQNAR